MTEMAQATANVAEEQTVAVEKLANNKAILAYVAEKFPRCFILEGEAKPLKINIFQDLAAALADDPKVSRTQLRHFLRAYTTNWRYLHGCRAGAQRVDLDGNPCGELEAEHVAFAAEKLAQAKAQVQEKRAEERKKQRVAQNKKTAKSEQKPNAKRAPARRRVNQQVKLAPLSAEVIAQLSKGSQVRVKAGERVQNATVLETKDGTARVQLQNGLTINVPVDRLFA